VPTPAQDRLVTSRKSPPHSSEYWFIRVMHTFDYKKEKK
jgi:hypothetical protein